MINEKISNGSGFEKWSRQGVNKSVDILLTSHLTFITDMILKLDTNPDLKQVLKAIILEGQTFFSYDTYDDSINEGIMFGLIKIENGNIIIPNRITQMLFSYRFISEEKDKLFHITESFDRSKYFKSEKLNMECVLSGFIDHFKNYYIGKNKFLEEYGRFIFMTFLRPIINGKGHFYMEPLIKDGKRTELIINFFEDESDISYPFSIDVYAYGISLCQIITQELQIPPISNINNLFKLVKDGLRPQIPDSTPLQWKKLIERCWDKDPNKRPTFTEICDILESSTFVNTSINIVAFNDYKKIIKPYRPSK